MHSVLIFIKKFGIYTVDLLLLLFQICLEFLTAYPARMYPPFSSKNRVCIFVEQNTSCFQQM